MTGLPLPAQFVGGPEILVIVLMGLIFFGLPLLVVLGGLGLWRAGSNKDERISELEQRIADLERERGDESAPDPEDDLHQDGDRPRDRETGRENAVDGDDAATEHDAATVDDPAAGRDDSAAE